VQCLKQLAGVHEATKQYAAATDSLRQARDTLHQLQAEKHVPLMEELDLLRRMISLREKTGLTKEAHNLKRSAFAEFGVGSAALLGYEEAVDVCRLAKPFWMSNTITDYAEEPECLASLPHEHMQLLFTLNVDRELVGRMVEECREIAGSNYQTRVDAMQATELGSWTDPGYWERLAEFYQCVSTLQGIAERITEKRYQTSDDKDWHDYLGFPDFRLADVNVLEAVLERGAGTMVRRGGYRRAGTVWGCSGESVRMSHRLGRFPGSWSGGLGGTYGFAGSSSLETLSCVDRWLGGQRSGPQQVSYAEVLRQSPGLPARRMRRGHANL